MPETPDLFVEVAMLRDQVDDMNRSVSALTRQSGLLESILEAMTADPVMAAVFLAVDGARTQKEIVTFLKAGKTTPSQATVSRKMDSLQEDWDLVRPHGERTASGVRYVHTSLARALKVERMLLRRLPTKKNK